MNRADAEHALATESAMTALARILRDRHHAGRRWVAADQIDDELNAAGITGAARGCVFRAAYKRGWLDESEDSHVSTIPAARGRRVAVWTIQAWRLPEQRKAT